MRGLIRITAVLVALLGAGGAFGAGKAVVTTADSDYFGFDLRTEQDLSLAECKSVCLADRACRAFTYNPKVKWCFLKSDFSTLNAFPGAIAGRVVDQAAGGPDIGAALPLDFMPGDLVTDARKAKASVALQEDQSGLGRTALLAEARSARDAGDIPAATRAMMGASPSIPPTVPPGPRLPRSPTA